jgi:hypothetical protein
VLTCIANCFPDYWIYGRYERTILDSIQQQIELHFADSNNVLLNLTWTGPQTDQQISDVLAQYKEIHNLFLLSTVDAVPHSAREFVRRFEQHGVKNIYRLGNSEGAHYFNFFAIVCADHHERYRTDDLVLRDIKYPYISYNRKPYVHRLDLVKELVRRGLKDRGVVTLGRPFSHNTAPEDQLYFSIGERDEDYVKYGHWYDLGTTSTPHQIPHDLFSLHNWPAWQHHFLHVVGSTTVWNEDDLFVNQINFKPLIGMRPFVINGQTKQYQWLRDQGFRTFEHLWPDQDLTVPGGLGDGNLTHAIANVIESVCASTPDQLQSMYNSILPDLVHNRLRFWEWCSEQQHRVNHVFEP